MTIGLAFALVVGMIIFSVGKTAMTLFARNTSINLAHISTRNAMDRIVQDIRQSITSPSLTGTLTTSGTFAQGSGTGGPSAGVQVETVIAGPYLVTGNNQATATSIAVTSTNGISPTISGSGWRVLIPGWQIDNLVTATSVSGNTLTCTLSGTLGQNVDASSAVIPAYIGLQVNYYVSGSNGDLIRRDGRGLTNSMVAKVLTPTPFSQPDADHLYIAIHLGATNSDYSNRAFVSSDILFNSIQVPFRGKLTNSN